MKCEQSSTGITAQAKMDYVVVAVHPPCCRDPAFKATKPLVSLFGNGTSLPKVPARNFISKKNFWMRQTYKS
jgi:hypothetical protein